MKKFTSQVQEENVIPSFRSSLKKNVDGEEPGNKRFPIKCNIYDENNYSKSTSYASNEEMANIKDEEYKKRNLEKENVKNENRKCVDLTNQMHVGKPEGNNIKNDDNEQKFHRSYRTRKDKLHDEYFGRRSLKETSKLVDKYRQSHLMSYSSNDKDGLNSNFKNSQNIKAHVSVTKSPTESKDIYHYSPKEIHLEIVDTKRRSLPNSLEKKKGRISLFEWEAVQRKRIEEEEKNRINKNLVNKPVSSKIKELVKIHSEFVTSMFSKDRKGNGTVDAKEEIFFQKIPNENPNIIPFNEPMKSPLILQNLLNTNVTKIKETPLSEKENNKNISSKNSKDITSSFERKLFAFNQRNIYLKKDNIHKQRLKENSSKIEDIQSLIVERKKKYELNEDKSCSMEPKSFYFGEDPILKSSTDTAPNLCDNEKLNPKNYFNKTDLVNNLLNNMSNDKFEPFRKSKNIPLEDNLAKRNSPHGRSYNKYLPKKVQNDNNNMDITSKNVSNDHSKIQSSKIVSELAKNTSLINETPHNDIAVEPDKFITKGSLKLDSNTSSFLSSSSYLESPKLKDKVKSNQEMSVTKNYNISSFNSHSKNRRVHLDPKHSNEIDQLKSCSRLFKPRDLARFSSDKNTEISNVNYDSYDNQKKHNGRLNMDQTTNETFTSLNTEIKNNSNNVHKEKEVAIPERSNKLKENECISNYKKNICEPNSEKKTLSPSITMKTLRDKSESNQSSISILVMDWEERVKERSPSPGSCSDVTSVFEYSSTDRHPYHYSPKRERRISQCSLPSFRSTPDRDSRPVSLSSILERDVSSPHSSTHRLSASEELSGITQNYRKTRAKNSTERASERKLSSEKPKFHFGMPLKDDGFSKYEKVLCKAKISSFPNPSFDRYEDLRKRNKLAKVITNSRDAQQCENKKKYTSTYERLKPEKSKNEKLTKPKLKRSNSKEPFHSKMSSKTPSKIVSRKSSLKRTQPGDTDSLTSYKRSVKRVTVKDSKNIKEQKKKESDTTSERYESIRRKPGGGWTKTSLRRVRLGSDLSSKTSLTKDADKNTLERKFRTEASRQLEKWAAGTQVSGNLVKKEGQRYSHHLEEEIKGGKKSSKAVSRRIVRRGSKKLPSGGEIVSETKEMTSGDPLEKYTNGKQSLSVVAFNEGDGTSRKIKSSADGERYFTQSVSTAGGIKKLTSEGVDNKTTKSVEVIGGKGWEGERAVQGLHGERVVVEQSLGINGRPSTVVKKSTSQSKFIVTKTKKKAILNH